MVAKPIAKNSIYSFKKELILKAISANDNLFSGSKGDDKYGMQKECLNLQRNRREGFFIMQISLFLFDST